MKTTKLLLLFILLYTTSFANPPRNDLWKERLKGAVETCLTLSFHYQIDSSGQIHYQRDYLSFGGNSFDVNLFCEYDPDGFLQVEESRPIVPGECNIHRSFIRDLNHRIQYEFIDSCKIFKKNVICLAYQYDADNKLTSIIQVNNEGKLIRLVETFQYDNKGNRIIQWVDNGISYTTLLNSDLQCIEEYATFSNGMEYYHNYHQYDASGKRIETRFTINKKLIEVRKNPYSDSILEDGVVLEYDTTGNWIRQIYVYDDTSGYLVVREIDYY